MQIRIRHLYRAAPETVQRATHAFAAPIENVCIDHRGYYIVVAQEFLYGSDIITVLHQGVRQESINYDVAASELSYPLFSIIDAVYLLSKEKRGKNENYLLVTFTDFRICWRRIKILRLVGLM